MDGGRTNERSNKGIRRQGEVGKRVVKATDMEENGLSRLVYTQEEEGH